MSVTPVQLEDWRERRILVAGHRGMVGSAIVRRLARDGCTRLATVGRAEVDLEDPSAVERCFALVQPELVFVAAARVGGIHANSTRPAEFIADNLAIELNLVRAAHRHGTARLLFLGSSCIYPRLAEQPMREEALLTGPLESSNEPYAIAKIAGIKLCESFNRQYGCDFRSVMPTNLYGPGDNYDPLGSHVIPALLRRFHEARRDGAASVTIWGSGTPRREFLHVDDLADACWFVARLARADYERETAPMRSHLNVGCGEDLSIAELARLIARIVGFQGTLGFDPTKPDGTPRKLLEVSRLARLGWTAATPLEQGLADAYHWYVEHAADARGHVDGA